MSLDPEDARDVFEDMTPVIGPRAASSEQEIWRLAEFFRDGSSSDFFLYPNTIVGQAVESGFREGTKIKQTHLTIERNKNLRDQFFLQRPTSVCDICRVDTARTYPWTDRILDLHHLLPLASGTRVGLSGTTFDDLVPICPSCHRAVHRFYDRWLATNDRRDFESKEQAVETYRGARAAFPGIING